jgi:hypothetical protein
MFYSRLYIVCDKWNRTAALFHVKTKILHVTYIWRHNFDHIFSIVSTAREYPNHWVLHEVK